MSLIFKVQPSIKMSNIFYNGSLVKRHHLIHYKLINKIKLSMRVGHTIEEFCVPITSLILTTLDFCLQQIFSNCVIFSNSLLILSLSRFSSTVRTRLSSTVSNPQRSLYNFFPFSSRLPNSSTFHLLKSTFRAFNLFAKTKLGAP